MTCNANCKCCKGACCCGSICTHETCQDCEDAYGTWAGPGTQCESSSCAQPTGACCGEVCAILSECECLQGGGEYQGDDTTCDPDPCSPADACCFWQCEYLAEIIWPEIENPEDVPDISEAMTAAGWVAFSGLWRKTIIGEENCDDPGVAAEKEQDLESEVDAIVADLGGYSSVAIDPGSSGPGCIEGLTQQACEETYLGTFHADAPCGDNPCCSGSCSEESPCRTLITGWDCDCVDGGCVPVENPLP